MKSSIPTKYSVWAKSICVPTYVHPVCAPRALDLTLKAPIRTAADNIHKYFFYCFLEKIRLDVSSESSENSLEASSLIFFER